MDMMLSNMIGSSYTGINPEEKEVINPQVVAGISKDASYFSNLIDTHQVTPVMQIESENNLRNVAKTMGDAIISHLDNVGSSFTGHVEKFHTLVHKVPSNLNLPTIISLQLEMSAISVQVEILCKCVSKSTQDIDQLCKLQ